MTQEEQNANEIKRLIEELTGALNTMSTMNSIKDEKKVVCEETLKKLNRLNVDANIVRQIMERADVMYGKTGNYATSAPLFEEFDRITNKNK